MEIKRDFYLQQLIDFMNDGQVKVITGIRRCGKSYLLNTIFKKYLLENGVAEANIFSISLDLVKDIQYRNPIYLAEIVRNKIGNSTDNFYLFVDEIQMSDIVDNPYNYKGKKITFYDTLNDLNSIPNLDIYVTGSNSKMLSSDILTEFRGRSDEIKVHPLSFKEYYSCVGGDERKAFDRYCLFGGMPFILSRPNDISIRKYLESLFSEVYLKDIIERNKVEHKDVLSIIVDLLCSSIGSLTNPYKISNTLCSKGYKISSNTVANYINYLNDAFLFNESKRYDIKGKSYIDSPLKYYCEDIGLRNARLGFRQQEPTHIMENIIYNELIIRGYSVDVGIVTSKETRSDGKRIQVVREIDFVANKSGEKVYIQSAYALPDEEKKKIEEKPFILTKDFFKKIIVRNDISNRWVDDNGILNINIIEFLLDKDIVN